MWSELPDDLARCVLAHHAAARRRAAARAQAAWRGYRCRVLVGRLPPPRNLRPSATQSARRRLVRRSRRTRRAGAEARGDARRRLATSSRAPTASASAARARLRLVGGREEAQDGVALAQRALRVPQRLGVAQHRRAHQLAVAAQRRRRGRQRAAVAARRRGRSRGRAARGAARAQQLRDPLGAAARAAPAACRPSPSCTAAPAKARRAARTRTKHGRPRARGRARAARRPRAPARGRGRRRRHAALPVRGAGGGRRARRARGRRRARRRARRRPVAAATPADAAPVVRAAADPGAPALVRAVAGVHPRRAARGAGVALDEALVRRALHEVEGACVRGGGALSRSPWAVVVLDCRTAPRARAASAAPPLRRVGLASRGAGSVVGVGGCGFDRSAREFFFTAATVSPRPRPARMPTNRASPRSPRTNSLRSRAVWVMRYMKDLNMLTVTSKTALERADRANVEKYYGVLENEVQRRIDRHTRERNDMLALARMIKKIPK